MELKPSLFIPELSYTQHILKVNSTTKLICSIYIHFLQSARPTTHSIQLHSDAMGWNILILHILILCLYSSPPQLRYPKLHYFRSYAILNWVQKNSSYNISPPVTLFLSFFPQLSYFLFLHTWCPKSRTWATQWPTSTELKIKFDPSLNRSWSEFFEIID